MSKKRHEMMRDVDHPVWPRKPEMPKCIDCGVNTAYLKGEKSYEGRCHICAFKKSPPSTV